MRISDWSSDVCSSDLRHVLRSFASQRPREFHLIGKIVAAIMHRGAVAVTAERHIGAMRVEPGRREDMAAIDRHALRLVDRRGIAMIDMGIEFEIDVDARSEEHTSELQSLMRISYAVFCLKKKTKTIIQR